MKRKKILIVTIIVLILIIVTSVIIYAKFNNSKNEDFLSSSNEITQDENLNQNMNELDTNLNEINNNIQENLVDNGISDNDKVISEEQDKKETRTKEDTSTQPKSTEEKQITTQKKNESSGQKTTKNQSSVTTQKQQESKKVETNPNKISNTFKSVAKIDIAPTTIANYLKFLEEAFIIEKANRYDIKGRKYISTPVKYYFCDIGIRNSIINFRQQEETHIMENIIYLELRRRGYNVDIGNIEDKGKNEGKDYFKQLEVDFIANKGNNKYYIQSAYSLPDANKREQEIRPFLKINDSFKKIIITMDNIKTWRDDNGIITMNIFDFLNNVNSLDY